MTASQNIGLITYRDLPDLISDDQILVSALRDRGVTALPVIWNDPRVEWGNLRLALFRSTWDYFHHYDDFMTWVDAIEQTVPLWNPAPLIRWNSHKRYLLDLAEQDIPVVPMIVVAQGQATDLAACLEERGWTQAVIKPAVGGGAFGTRFVQTETLRQGQQHLDALLPTHDMLIQPYMAAVEEYGERSLVFINGHFSHAARKDPALSPEAPVGRNTGGETQAVPATAEEIAVAERALSVVSSPWIYARVDTIRDTEGHPLIMELEMIEPLLNLRHAPAAAEHLADAIHQRLQG